MKLSLTPKLTAVAPGEDAEFEVTIANDGDLDLAPTLTISGFDPQQITLPDELVVLDPGQVATAVVRIRVPLEANAGERRIGFTVTDPDGSHRQAAVTATMQVGDRPDVAVEVTPPTSRGRRSAKLQTILHNRSSDPIHVRLDGAGEGIEVSFYVDEITLDPGQDLPVPTRVERTRRSWFREIRHGALISVRSDGAPVTAAASFTQQPLLSPLFLKVVAFVMVLALWASAVVAITTHMNADDIPLAKFLVAPDFGDDRRDLIDARGVGLETDAIVQGTVDGPADPAGTSVVIERVAFGDEGTTDPENGDGQTRLAALTSVRLPLGQVIDRIETTTDDRGTFRFADGLVAPAFYRVTATRPGFEVASRVVTTSEEEPEVDVELVLDPAAGSMSGAVTTTGGSPIGGADITITDGDLIYSATSATEGNVGSWSVSGIATPQTYQVIVQQRGFATATLSVDLDGGQQLTGVNAQLEGGLGTIRGRVTHRGEGVGGVRVALEGNPTERETTTLTEGELAGTFDFPALDFGTYQLTFSAPGWLTQTAEVVVDRGDVQIDVSDLRPSTAVVQGVVTQEVAPGGGCRYPDPEFPEQRTGAVLAPCGGVGVTLVGDDTTLRTTSATGDGSFQLSGVPGGQYLVRFERFGYVSQFYEVATEPGDILTLPSDAAAAPPPDDPDTAAASLAQVGGEDTIRMRLTAAVPDDAGRIQAVIRDAADPSEPFDPPAGTVITVDGQPDAVTESLADGAFLISGLRAGAATVRIDAPGYDVRTEVVRVSAQDVSDAGIIDITALGSLALRITGGQSAVVGDAEVFVVPDPFVYEPDGRTPPRLEELDEDVSACTRSFELDGQDWTLDGLCASTDAVGDVEFTRSFGTGNFVLVTPTNQQDRADDARFRATTVPLDHERLVRRVDIDSGSTTRLDPNLRRYAVVQGNVRAPSSVDEGLDAIDVERSDITFERVDGDGNVLALPEGAPTPRLSGNDDQGSTLARGQYRIDRIPADMGETQFEWRLVISTNVGTFTRGPGQPEGFEAIAGLQFNDTRTINAILQPNPEEITWELRYRSANETEAASPVPGALLRVRGTSVFEQLEQAPFFRPTFTTCPGSGCSVPGEFDFGWRDENGNLVGDPRVVRSTAFTGDLTTQPEDDLWLASDGATPTGDFTIPAFFRPGPIRYEIYAPGFEPVELPPNDEASFELETPEEDADGNRPLIIEEVEMTALPRNVSGTITLDPAIADANIPAFMQDLDVTANADIFTGLSVTLDGVGVTPQTVTPDTDGSFTFPDAVTPGAFELTIEGNFTPPTYADGFDRIVDRTVSIQVPPAADPDFTIAATDTQVDRTGVVRGQVLGRDAAGNSTGPRSGVEVTLQRAPFPLFAAPQFADLATLTTCDVPTDTTGGPGCGEGLVTFVEVDLGEFTSSFFFGTRPSYLHRLRVEQPGFLTATSANLELLGGSDGGTVGYRLVDPLVVDAYGAVTGSVNGIINYNDDADPLDVATGEVTVTLVDAVPDANGDPIVIELDGQPVVAEAGGAPGEFVFPSTFEVPPRDGALTGVECVDVGGFVTCTAVAAVGDRYELLFESATHEPLVTDQLLTFGLNSRTDTGTSTLRAEPASVAGLVSGPAGEVMYGPGGTEITVSIDRTQDAGFTPLATTTADPGDGTDAGAYSLADLVPGEYELTFFHDVNADDRRFASESQIITLAPGEARQLDVALSFEPATVSGTVSTRDFDGGAASPQDGVKVILTPPDGVPLETTTAGGGTYSFSDVEPDEAETYTIEFSLDGYVTESHGALILLPNADATVNRTLTAEEADVEVSLSSAVTTISPTDLDGVDVVATYDGPETPPGPGPVTAATSGGIATFSLAPGAWEFTVPDAATLDFPVRPHLDPGAEALTVPLNDGATLTATITLEPYFGASGTVVDGSGNLLDGVQVSVSDPDGVLVDGPVLIDPETTVAGGAWQVWLPNDVPTPGNREVLINFVRDGFADGEVGIDKNTYTGGSIDETFTVELFGEPRDVVVTLSSVVGAAELVDLQIEADRDGTPNRTVSVVEIVDGDAVARFVGDDALAPGGWTLSSLDGGTLTVPHVDFAGVALNVPAGTGAFEPADPMVTFAEINGTVLSGADDLPLDGAEVAVAQGTNAVTTTAVDGTWRIGAPELVATDLAWSATDHEPDTRALVAADVQGSLTEDVTLTPTERDLVVSVTSSQGGGSLDGVTVTATRGTETVSAVTGSTGEDPGEATLTLTPDTWTLTTSGATGLTPPHVDESGQAFTVAAGSGDVTESLTLTRYAQVGGTVQVSDYAGAAATDPPADATVAITQGGDSVATPTVATDGAWSVFIPPGLDTTITVDANDYEPDTIMQVGGYTGNNALGTTTLIATPITVSLSVTREVVDGDGNTTIEPAEDVTVTATPDSPVGFDPEVVLTQTGPAGGLAAGAAELELAPGGTWSVVASDTSETSDPQLVEVQIGAAPNPNNFTLVLGNNSKLVGSVTEIRGTSQVAISGVRIRAEQPDIAFQTTSKEPDESGDNYLLQARAGTWRITATRNGEVTLVDEAFDIRQDGPDSEPNRLDIVLPATSIDVSGQVVGESGAGVEGASITAVSGVGTVTTTTDDEGRYTLAGLDNRQTWAVTFAPPPGYDAQPVTRYVALSGDTTVELALNQTLPTALGQIDLSITGGQPGQNVAVSLSEQTPFPTLNSDGRIDRAVQLGGDGTAVIEFEDLVPGDGNSLPQNRFTLDIVPDGQDAIVRSNLDVAPGGTTLVEVDLGGIGVLTKEVELTLTSDGEPVTDADVRLRKDPLLLGPPVSPPDSNVYTFSNVEPGTWEVLADGYEDTSIEVPADDAESFSATLSLTALPSEDDEEGLEGDAPEGAPEDLEGQDADGAEGSTDGEGGTDIEGGTDSEDNLDPGSTGGDGADTGDGTSDDTDGDPGDGTTDGATTDGTSDSTSDGTQDGQDDGSASSGSSSDGDDPDSSASSQGSVSGGDAGEEVQEGQAEDADGGASDDGAVDAEPGEDEPDDEPS